MTSGASERRPPQVTFSGWLVIGGSVIVLLGAFEAMSSLRTLETRAMIERFLEEPPGSTLGIGFERARDLRQGAVLLLGACAAATAILGIFVLRRDKPARIALTVLAVPLFLAGSIAGGFASAVVTVSIVMLWLEPARSWFAGRPLPERFRLPRDGGRAGRARDERPREDGPTYGAPPAASPSPDPPVQAPVDQPGNQPGNQPGAPVQQPWGQQPSGQQAPSSSPYPTYPPATPPYQPPPGSPYAGAAPYQGFGDPGRGPQGWQPPAPTRRPGAVLAACIATWIASGLVALTMIASVAAVVADPDFVMDEMRRTQPEALEQGITSDYLVGAVAVMGGFVVLWCLVACVLAVFTLRGRGWARILLLVSAGVAGLLCLVSVLVAPPAVVGVPAAALAFFCLLRSEVAAWFAARSRGRS